MKRNMIVPVRFTEEEYLLIKKMIEEEAEEKSVSKFIREKIFLPWEDGKKYKKILLALNQMRTDFHHALLILNRTGSEEAMKEEIEKEVEILSQLQEEIKKENGSNGS